DSSLIDVTGFLDHHILNVYPKNVDAFRLSGYMYKPRDGLFVMGPVWDYDRTMGCAEDGRPASWEGWGNDGGDGGTLYFQTNPSNRDMGSWYGLLFQERPPTADIQTPWARAYRARWRELRDGPLRTENILGQIDEWSAELQESAQRNFQRWSAFRPRWGTFQSEVDHLKDWLARRADWIDSEFIETPTFSHPGGLVDRGLQVEIDVSEGLIYYTVNGPDPRSASGLPVAEALLYTDPVTIDANTRIRARLRAGETVWSELVEATYVTDILPLVITEIMYNPIATDDDGGFTVSNFEFIELYNAGDEPIDLAGVRLARTTTLGYTILFDFAASGISQLPASGILLAVNNPEAFAHRYGDAPPVAGEFTGTLSNATMSLVILGPYDEEFLAFTYDDDWVPETDGSGYSLAIRDPHGPLESWDLAESWMASAEVHGSPGVLEGAAGHQLPGDLNQDLRLNITDAAGLLFHLFRGGASLPCATEAANRTLLDASGDGVLDLADAVHVLSYIFLAGEPPSLGVVCVPIAGCPDRCGGSTPR
ncbi:MAG: CotH kinase family protein, partial [Planctomycetes bacterium]|nr:CotH kinase family protein [Planctomycetota bacterium]